MNKEKVLIQMTKAVRLLEDESYNEKTLNPMREVITELRSEMGVHRVKTEIEEKVIYNT